jgi:hypothetical protein
MTYTKEEAHKYATFLYELNEELHKLDPKAIRVIDGLREALRQGVVEMFVGLPQRVEPEQWFNSAHRSVWASQIVEMYNRYYHSPSADDRIAELEIAVSTLTAKLNEAARVTEEHEQEPAAEEEQVATAAPEDDKEESKEPDVAGEAEETGSEE